MCHRPPRHPGRRIEDQTLGVIFEGLGQPWSPAQGVGRKRLHEGTRALLAVVATDTEPLFIPTPDAIQSRLDRTIGSWRRWAELLNCDGPWKIAVRRSALALKALLAEQSGAIAAAATTSLPERIGGPKNWDYRYAWVRDSSFTLDALINLGLHEEVHGAVSWLLSAIRDNGGDLHVFYTLDGTMRIEQATLDIPAGGTATRPLRQSASGQTQLGTYGDLFDTISRYCAEGHLIDPTTGRMLADLADRCLRRVATRDSGIWELETCRHYTISKIGCWVALDRAVHLAETGQIPDCTSSAGVRAQTRSAPGSTTTAGPTPNRRTRFTLERTTSMPPCSSPDAPALNAAPDWRRPSTPSPPNSGMDRSSIGTPA